jgi:cytochrome c oxidase subunit 2
MFSLALNFLPSASTQGDKFDLFMLVAITIGVVLFVSTIGAAIYFAFRYRSSKVGPNTPYIPGNYLVEFLSIFGIAIWVAVFFIWGWRDYSYMITPKMDEMEINVIGQQWSWQIQYPDGKSLTNEMVVPRNKAVKLVMTSKDVLHSFFLPSFRVKMDTVPGQFTSLHFTATKTGTFEIFCAEYCGTAHSKMIGKVHVLEPEDYKKWQDGLYTIPEAQNALVDQGKTNAPQLSLAELGANVYKSRSCNACHSVNGDPMVGPTFKGLYGSEQELIGGAKVTVDENYIRESVMDPMKKVVKGFSPSMPTYRGLLSDEEVNQLIAYMKTLK